MPKRTLGPFPELANLEAVDINAAHSPQGARAAVDAFLERMQLLHDTLEAAGCHCNGHALGNERDSDWGDDISELIVRCTPHDTYTMSREGRTTVSRVSINLETLRVEIDSNNEICAWIYEEPEA